MSPRDPVEWMQHVSEKAAQWGADCELDACCEWVGERLTAFAANLKAVRRPKPPTLKEQALQELNLTKDLEGAELSRTQVDLIRRALEALPE
jgi:hypothetical protein